MSGNAAFRGGCVDGLAPERKLRQVARPSVRRRTGSRARRCVIRAAEREHLDGDEGAEGGEDGERGGGREGDPATAPTAEVGDRRGLPGVAPAPDRPHGRPVAAELRAQGVDGEVERLLPDVARAAVHREEDLPARKRAPARRDERAEEGELRRRQRERPAVRKDGSILPDRDSGSGGRGRRVWRGVVHRGVFAANSTTASRPWEPPGCISNTFRGRTAAGAGAGPHRKTTEVKVFCLAPALRFLKSLLIIPTRQAEISPIFLRNFSACNSFPSLLDSAPFFTTNLVVIQEKETRP